MIVKQQAWPEWFERLLLRDVENNGKTRIFPGQFLPKTEKSVTRVRGGGAGTTYIHLKRKQADWIGHIFSWNWLLKHIIEGNIERAGRHKQLLDDLKQTRKYWKMSDEAPDCTLWRTFFFLWRGNGPVVKVIMPMTISRNTRCKYEH